MARKLHQSAIQVFEICKIASVRSLLSATMVCGIAYYAKGYQARCFEQTHVNENKARSGNFFGMFVTRETGGESASFKRASLTARFELTARRDTPAILHCEEKPKSVFNAVMSGRRPLKTLYIWRRCKHLKCLNYNICEWVALFRNRMFWNMWRTALYLWIVQPRVIRCSF